MEELKNRSEGSWKFQVLMSNKMVRDWLIELVCMKTAARSVTYLFGGEFYQGSFIALKGGKRKCQKCEMRHFLPKERWLCSSTHMKGRQESCTNRGLRGVATHARVCLNPSSAFCIVALMISQQRQPPSSAHLWKPTLTWEMDFWTDYSKINSSLEDAINLQGFFSPFFWRGSR